jgi:hypothetical protein
MLICFDSIKIRSIIDLGWLMTSTSPGRAHGSITTLFAAPFPSCRHVSHTTSILTSLRPHHRAANINFASLTLHAVDSQGPALFRVTTLDFLPTSQIPIHGLAAAKPMHHEH